MDYVLESLFEISKHYDLMPFIDIYDYISNTGIKPKKNGKDVLFFNNGGLQYVEEINITPEARALFKDYDWQKNIYWNLPLMPKTATGKFTGKVELHTNNKYLEKIKFFP